MSILLNTNIIGLFRSLSAVNWLHSFILLIPSYNGYRDAVQIGEQYVKWLAYKQIDVERPELPSWVRLTRRAQSVSIGIGVFAPALWWCLCHCSITFNYMCYSNNVSIDYERITLMTIAIHMTTMWFTLPSIFLVSYTFRYCSQEVQFCDLFQYHLSWISPLNHNFICRSG